VPLEGLLPKAYLERTADALSQTMEDDSEISLI
jgi:hypothetical protein